jgi:hypothetical protein
LQTTLHMKLDGRFLQIGMQSISQELRALRTTMAIKDSKVENLRITAFARSSSITLLQRLVRACQTDGLAFGKGGHLDSASLMRVFIVRPSSSQASSSIVMFRRLERDSDDRGIASYRGQSSGQSTRSLVMRSGDIARELVVRVRVQRGLR